MKRVVTKNNTPQAKTIEEKLKVTKGVCPSYPFNTNKRNNICPCKDFREQTWSGDCFCGLYHLSITDDDD